MANRHRQQAGLDYEHEIANGVYDRSGQQLFPIRAGYSGNSDIPLPDVAIDDGDKVHAIELKNTVEDRISVTFDEDELGKADADDDLSELVTFAEGYPRTVCPYVGVRFKNRQLVLAKLWLEAPDRRSMLNSAKQTCPTQVNVTRADNLSFHKPELDEWISAKKGDDIEYVLETIGVEQP